MTAEFFDVQLDVTFTAPNVVENIASQDNISAAFGKISKWYTSFAWSAWTAPTVEVTGSGNAVTSATYGTGANENKLILTLGSTFLTQHPTIPVTTDTTSTSAPSFGGTFTAVDSVTRDANGHVTTLNTKTVTIPNTTMGAATSSAAGTIGLVPAPAAGEHASFLRGDGTWAIPISSPYTAGTGLVLSGLTFNHSNSVTAVTTASLLKFTYDAQGHITGSSAATSSDLPSHTHYEQDVEFDTRYSYKPYDNIRFPIVVQPLINTMRTNRFVFLPSSSITIEHSTDGGSTYTDSGYTDTGKCNLFISRHAGAILIGPNTTAERTTSMRTMVTITRDSRYTRIDRFYIWFSTSGHTAYVDIQYATNAADTTWVDWRTNIQLLGWSGPNLINGPVLVFGASDTHVKKIRFIFRYATIRADYKTSPSRIFEIAAYSDYPAWTATNNMMMNDHLYYWDKDQMAYFPAEVKVPTQVRIHSGNYGALFRTDGTNTHILFTDSGSALDGTWNSLRPFSISNSTGLITMNEGLKVNTKDGAFLEIHGLTTTSYAYGSSSPKIRFTNSVSDQNADLIWDDHDAYCTPASLTLIGNQDGTYFIAPRIRLNSSSTTQALLDFNDANNKGAYLRYSTSTRGYGNIIAMLPYADNGIGVVFNHTGGGYCCIGAGESPSNFTTAVMSTGKNPYGTAAWNYGIEQMCITSDVSIYFVSGANGLNTTNHTDWTHLRTAIFDENGYFKPSVNLNGSIGTAGNRWLSMYAKRYFGRLSQQINLTRQTTANLACEGTMSMQLIQATASMTTGKPAIDGYILDFDWDNTGAYKAQLSIPNSAAGSIQWRPQAGYVNWDNAANLWRYVHDNTKGVGKTGFLAYPTDGSYYEQTTQNITGALVITLPFTKTNGQCMIHFSVDIYNYDANQSVTYVIAGYCYNDEKWYQCTAYSLGRAMSNFNNLVVRFGCVTGGNYKIQIGETTTVWKYPQVSIRDVTVGYKQANQTTYAANIGNWTVTFESSNVTNVTKTITYTRPFLPFDVATGSADANTFLDRTGWFNWNTTTGSNMPTTNYGILLSRENPSVQVFIPDNATGIYFRRRANTTATPTAWWGITGTAGTTYDLNNLSGKYAFVVDETSDFASYAWHKFAEVTLSDAYADASITFLVSKTWGNVNHSSGILTAHVRTSSTKVYESGQFGWLVIGNTPMDPTEFVMVYTNTASTSCKVELWHKQTTRYDGWIFKVLKEHSRTVYGASPWTLFKHNSHGSATYTAGTGTIVSTANTIANTSASANKINTNAGDYQTPVYFSNGVPVVVNTAASGANFGIVPQVRNGNGVMEIGRYIDFHSTAAGTTDYDIRFDASSTSLLTMTCNAGTPQFRISGTLPRLRFTQTTSGSAYDNASCGITAYPGNTTGVNLVIQGGGNTIIGAGESPTALYTDIITTNKNPYGTTALTGGERMYITSDNEIYFVSGANGLSTTAFTDWTNLKTMIYDSSGYLKPSVNNEGSVGTSALKWASMYATTFYGLLNGTLALGTALSSSNNIDTDTKTTTGNWYSSAASVSATIANTPVKGYGFHVFNIPTTNSNNTYQKQFLIGNTAIIPYMYRYLSNGSWRGGWRSPGTGFMYVIGTQTASTAAWTGVIPIPELYDGLTIAYYLPYASAASTNVTLNLTLSNGQTSGAINVYYTGTSRMTTHYGAGSTIILTYFSAGAIKVSGTATTDARWTHSDYNTNTNTYVTQSNSTITANYRALMLGYNNSTAPSDLTASVTNQVYASANLYAQPSTGLIACNGRKLITPFAIQTASSIKRQKISLQTLMTWLITTKQYIHSGIYEHVVLQTTLKYADNDILRLTINGVNYEMDLAGVRIEYIGQASSYNTGAFTLKIISNPAPSFTSSSGWQKFPPSTIAFYTCNGSEYNPVWRMIMNGACGQPKIFESTDNTQVFPVPIEVTGLFINWKVLLAQCTRLIYGGGDECSSFQVIIPLEYLKSLGTSGEMHIPLPFTIENNPIGRNYMILKYVNDNKFTIGYHNNGIDSIGGRGLWTMYGMY